MRQATSLTLEERHQVLALLDNQFLLSAMRKIQEEEAATWARSLKLEATKGEPNTNLMIQYAAREAAAEDFEKTLRKAVGL